MPKRIPISAAKAVATEQGCSQVIICAWDGRRTHVVTYGASVEDCDQAAQGGDRIKAALGWPEHLKATPSRVKALQRQVEELLTVREKCAKGAALAAAEQVIRRAATDARAEAARRGARHSGMRVTAIAQGRADGLFSAANTLADLIAKASDA